MFIWSCRRRRAEGDEEEVREEEDKENVQGLRLRILTTPT